MKNSIIITFLVFIFFQKGYSQAAPALVEAAFDLITSDYSKIDLSKDQRKQDLKNNLEDIKQQLNLTGKQTRKVRELMNIRMEKESAILTDRNIKPEYKDKYFQIATDSMHHSIVKILEKEQLIKYNQIKSNY